MTYSCFYASNFLVVLDFYVGNLDIDGLKNLIMNFICKDIDSLLANC